MKTATTHFFSRLALSQALLTAVLILLFCPASAQSYCTSGATSSIDSEIDLVVLGLTSNSSANVCATYTNFTSVIATTVQYGSLSYSVTLGSCGGNFRKGAKIFVDWNQDYDFADTLEQVAVFGGGTSLVDETYSGTIEVPVFALTGLTRLRIVCSEIGSYTYSDVSQLTACGSFPYGETEDYSLQITSAPVNDIALLGLLTPVTSTAMSNNEVVRVRVRNMGSAPASGFTLSYLINGTGLVSQTFPDLLQPGQTDTLSFTTTAALAPVGIYQINVLLYYALDGNATNNSLTTTVQSLGNQINLVTGTMTLSTCDIDLYDNGGPSAIYSDNFDGGITLFPSSPGAKIRVQFVSFVTEVNYDFLYIYNGNSIQAPLLLNGHSGSVNPGSFVSTAADGSLTIRFHTDVNVAYAGFTAAVDCFFPTPFDLELTAFITPNSDYGLSAAEEVTIGLKNNGTQVITGFPLVYLINGGSPVFSLFGDTLAAGDSTSFTFPLDADLSVPGTYEFTAFGMLPGDTTTQNDTILHQVIHYLAGCTDPTALNYNPQANVDNGQCTWSGEYCQQPAYYGLINDPPVTGSTTAPFDTMFFRFQADTLYYNVVVSLCGSAYDTKLAVWQSCGASAYLAYNDDYCGYSSQVSFYSLNEGFYLVKVYGYNSSFGNFTLSVTGLRADSAVLGCMDSTAMNYNPLANVSNGSCQYPPPPGHTCQVPIPLTLPVVNYAGTTSGFGDDYENLPCGGGFLNGDDIVYSFQVSQDGFLSGNVSGTWAGMVLFSACPESGGSCLATGTGFNGGGFSGISVSPGTYILIVSNYPAPQSIQFILNLSFVPAVIIEGCTDPQALNYNPQAWLDNGSCLYPGDLCSVPLSYGIPGDPLVTSLLDSLASLWYSFTIVQPAQQVVVSLCGSNVDTRLEIWDNCQAGSPLAFNDDYCGNQSSLLLPTLPPGVYLARAQNLTVGTGTLVLEIFIQPVVPGCTDPAAINFNPLATVNDGSCIYPPPVPAWTVNSTGVYHSIYVPQSALITVDGNSIQPGDYLGVFYDSLGVLICAGFEMWTSFDLTVSAWGSNGGAFGFQEGDSFHWKIWRAATQTESGALASYMASPVVMPNGEFFVGGGLSGIQSLVSVTTPPWSYTITGLNHTVLIPATIPLSINGIPLYPGDYIGVFYQSGSSQACGGYVRWDGISTTVACWGAHEGYAGFGDGEPFQWKIWKQVPNTVFSAQATYMASPVPMPNGGSFAANGLSGLSSLTATSLVTQTLEMVQGWSLISTYIQPVNPLVSVVFAPVASNIVILKNYMGQVFWPQIGLNSIGNMQTGLAYLVKMTSLQNLTVQGAQIIPELTPLTLPAGWFYLGYLRTSQAPIATMLAPITPAIHLVKDGAGHTFWPLYNINTIGNMKPGRGYQVRLTYSLIFTYPPN